MLLKIEGQKDEKHQKQIDDLFKKIEKLDIERKKLENEQKKSREEEEKLNKSKIQFKLKIMKKFLHN